MNQKKSLDEIFYPFNNLVMLNYVIFYPLVSLFEENTVFVDPIKFNQNATDTPFNLFFLPTYLPTDRME